MFNHIVKINSKTVAHLLIALIGILYLQMGMRNILQWDVMGYHSYLPLAFTEHSFSVNLDYFKVINERYNYTSTLYQYVDLPNGKVFIKYPIGWAIFYTPFYLIADVWAASAEYLRDGFSYPYQLMALIASYIYFVLNVLIVRKVLKYYFKDSAISWLLIFFVLGTNYFHMSLIQVGTNHNLMVMLVGLLIWQTHRFHAKISLLNGVLLGLIVGSMALVRTPSVVIALFPVLFQYKNYGKTIFDKIRYFLKNHLQIVIVALLVAAFTYSPQLIYWKLTSGSWLLNSYQNNPGEGMDWLTPYFLKVLFSFKNGWLIYTPMMIFSLIGMAIWFKKDRVGGLSALITFGVFFYVVSCWTCWWYANTFGHRAMVDIYPLLLIALGFFIEKYNSLTWKGIFGLLICFNLFQTYQERLQLLDGNVMTKEAYFSQFFQIKPASDYQKSLYILDVLQYEDELIDVRGFKPLKTYHLPIDSFMLSPADEFSPFIRFNPREICDDWHLLIQTTVSYAGDAKALEGKYFTANAMYKGKTYNWRGKDISHLAIKHDSIKKEVTYSYFVPHLRSKKDLINVALWGQSGEPLVLTNLKVEVYKWNPYISPKD